MIEKEKARFPLIMTVLSFFFFTFTYLGVTLFSLEKHYLHGLIFAIPFLCFGTIAILQFKEKLSSIASSIITGLLIPVFTIGMLIGLIYVWVGDATTEITDSSKYKSALATTDPVLTNSFPSQIPDDASNIKLFYRPAFLQGGENLILKFECKAESIATYQETFAKKANEFKLTDPILPDYDYQEECFDLLGYDEIPSGYTFYLLYSKPYKLYDWNHGSYSFVAINRERNAIIFAESRW